MTELAYLPEGKDLQSKIAQLHIYQDLFGMGTLMEPEFYVRKLQIPPEQQQEAIRLIRESADYQAAEALMRIEQQTYETLDQLIADLVLIGDRSLKNEDENQPGSNGHTGQLTADALRKVQATWQANSHLNTQDAYDAAFKALGRWGITTAHNIRPKALDLLNGHPDSGKLEGAA